MPGSGELQLPEAKEPLGAFGLGPDPLSDPIAYPHLSSDRTFGGRAFRRTLLRNSYLAFARGMVVA